MPDPELVERFVVVHSTGGPYEDGAFVAGATYGRLSAHMELHAAMASCPPPLMVPTALVPQVDLCSMRLGFLPTFTPWDEHPGEWTLAEFAYQEPEPDAV